MNNKLHVSEFISKSTDFPIIDVRSPGEFKKGHIPGAFHIPLFTDEERAHVGTTYVQVGKNEAVLEGLKIVGPKMASFVEQSMIISPSRKVLVHCWRGGMRSQSFAWLLGTAGFEVFTLSGGYKEYRNQVLSFFESPFKLRVVGGYTGSGKTEVLKHLSLKQQQVVDLEALANHKGSSFGSLGQLPQPSVEQFENDLFQNMKDLDIDQPIWIEDESSTIGKVYIPPSLWKQMRLAPLYNLEVSREARVEKLVKEYGTFDISLLKDAVERIQKRLGGLVYKECIEALENGDLKTVAEKTLIYYDKAYRMGREARDPANVFTIESETVSPEINAKLLLKFQSQLLEKVIH